MKSVNQHLVYMNYFAVLILYLYSKYVILGCFMEQVI